MKIIEYYFYIFNQIKNITNDKIEAKSETELILLSNKFKEIFGKSFELKDIFGKSSEEIIEKGKIIELDKILKKRSEGLPLQYALDEAWFYGYKFHVYLNNSTKTLIPRNETEYIVEKVIEYSESINNYITALDIGTGSCCIPISSILSTNVNLHFDAIDPYTFEIAKKNISNYNLNKTINLYNLGVEDIRKTLINRYDIITANLPYISHERKIKELNLEPSEALYSKEKGFYLIKKLLQILPHILKESGKAFIEIDPSHSKYLSEFKELKVKISKDLNNLERVAEIKIN